MSIDEKGFKAVNDTFIESENLLRAVGEVYEANKTHQPVGLSQELSLLFALQSVCDYIRNRHNYGNQVAAKKRTEVLQKAEAAMQAFGDKSATLPKRESGDRLTVMNTALGVILNYRDLMPPHIVRWAESKVYLSDAESITDIEDGAPK